MLDCSKKLIIFHILYYYSISLPNQAQTLNFDEAPPFEMQTVL